MPHSQLAGQQLSEKDLLNVMEELADVKAKWYNIGLGLGLSYVTLDGIKADHSNISDCLREALKTWLKTHLPPPTWSKVVEALRTKIVGEAKLAAHLEQKYKTLALLLQLYHLSLSPPHPFTIQHKTLALLLQPSLPFLLHPLTIQYQLCLHHKSLPG